MKLLFAEDDRDICRAVSTVLKSQKYAVDAVFTGTDAYSYASTGQCDGMVLDIMAPGMDGLEVLQRLRRQKVPPPVLLLRAKAKLEDRVAGLDSGEGGYLPKPLQFQNCGSMPRHFLYGRRRGVAPVCFHPIG